MKVGLLATECGYRDGSYLWFFKSENGYIYSTNTKGGISGNEKTFKQPTQAELQSWLRKKNIEVYAIPTIYDGVKTYSSILQNETFMKYVATNVKTYEKAIELSLAEGLNLLKNTNK